MGTMRYKPSDKVRIKSIDWYNENKDEYGCIACGDYDFISHMAKFCGKIITIKEVYHNFYTSTDPKTGFYWTDEMIEGLVEEENNDCEKCGLTRNSTRCLFMDNCPYNKPKNIIEIPKDYVIKDENGNVINATKIVLEKKKKEYPKTYEECCKILGFLNVDLCFNADYRNFDASKEQWKRLGLMNQFYQLLICRDAYWKIAGEEMGLDKPWEPSGNEDCFIISRSFGEVFLFESAGDSETFEFPTREMRDAFYENFKELIEFVKELL